MSPSDIARLTHGIAKPARDRFRRVAAFAVKHLAGLHRRTGESYAEHGLEVAQTLREFSDDQSLLSVAVLNDLLVHPNGEALLDQSPLTEDERSLVRSLHSLRRLNIDVKTRDLDTVIDAFTGEPRLLPLRMAHRLNDVRHFDRFPVRLRRSIAHETLHMYSAIAGRLGMHVCRHEMEDRCFRFLQPGIVAQLEKEFELHAAADSACLEHGRKFLLRKLRDHDISCDIDWRVKGLYSTYRKMVVKRRKFSELTDRLALRVVVWSMQECYHALGVIHACMHPIPGKLKDYIGAPKENGYRSIHTVVWPLPGVTEQPMEIQIRTKAMHRECEVGIASHGEYKQNIYSLKSGEGRVELFRNLQSLREEAHSPKQFEQALRTYFDESHIALFDPENTLYHLKQPVSALDFACTVHGKRVKYLKSVRVNGRERPMDTELRNGDTVEARFGRRLMLRETWVNACRHRGNRKIIRSLLAR